MVLHVTFWLYKQIKAPIFSHKRGSASYHGFWMAIGVMSSNYWKTVNIHPQLSQLLPELVEFYRYVKVTCAITCNKTHLYQYFFVLNDLTMELKILYVIRFSNLAILQIKGPNFNILFNFVLFVPSRIDHVSSLVSLCNHWFSCFYLSS